MYPRGQIKDHWLDKLYEVYAPKKALERHQAKVALARSKNSYLGASRTRPGLSNYFPGGGDADSDQGWDLGLLRERSRDLLRNCPLAVGALNTVCTNVVGTGLTLQSRIDRDFLKLSDDEADALEAQIEREFRLWANSTACDVTQTLAFAELQELVLRSTLESGDCFVFLTTKKSPSDGLLPFALQVIEADRVCNVNHAPNSKMLVDGVCKDATGAPMAYQVLDTHPGSLWQNGVGNWFEIPAFHPETGLRQMIHLYRTLRPGQTRGVPYLAPVIESLKQLGEYSASELNAALVSSYFTVFIKTPHGESGLQSDRRSAGDSALRSGSIVDLAEGEDISTVNPGRPNGQFDPFVQAILRQIGVALELPFEVLVKHFTASYSAARAALLEAWRFFMSRREWLARRFCQVVYEVWFMESVLLGRISAPGFIQNPLVRAAYCGAHWIGPAQGQIDPLKEIKAAQARMDAGISTLARETAALTGEEWEKTHRQRAKEQRLRDEQREAVDEN